MQIFCNQYGGEIMKKALIMVPSLLIGIPVTIAATFYVLLFTSSSPGRNSSFVPENISTEEFLERQVKTRAFKDIERDKQISFTLDEGFFNQLLYNAKGEMEKNMDIPAELTDTIGFEFGDLYAVIKDHSYNFYFDVNSKYFKTGLAIETTLEDDAKIEGKDAYVFTLKNLRVGRLGILGTASTIGITEQIKMDDAFKDSGLSIKADMKNNRLYYLKEDVEKDMKDMLMKDAGSDDIMSSIMDAVELELNFKDGIHANAKLNKLIDNTEKTDSVGHDNAEIRNGIKTIVNGISNKVKSGEIAADAVESNFDSAMEAYSQEIKSSESVSVNSIVEDQINENIDKLSDDDFDGVLASVGETEINKVLKTSGLIGKKLAVWNYKEEIVYMVIDNLYADMFVKENKQYLNFAVGLNINGLETRAIIETEFAPEADQLKGTFEFKEVYLGNHRVTSDFKNTVFGYMGDAIEGMGSSNDWVSYIQNSGVGIDFEKLLDLGDKAKLISGTRSVEVAGEGLASNGELKILYTKA